MKPVSTGLLYAGIALLSLTTGIFTARWLDEGNNAEPSARAARPAGVPDSRVDFSLPDLDGRSRSLSEWDGKVVLLNFWATWCPPCRKEIPDFVALREQFAGQPFEVIGVAVEHAEPVRDFIDAAGVEYPILLAELMGLQIMLAYGNQLTTLPYTVIIDRHSRVVKTFRAGVGKEDILAIVQPLLEQAATH